MTGRRGSWEEVACPRTTSGSRPTERSTSSTPSSGWLGLMGSTRRPMRWPRSSRTSCSSSARHWPTRRPDGPFHQRHHRRARRATRDRRSTRSKPSSQPLTQFILPGGTLAAAHIHLARTVCRRAERLTVRLSRQPGEDVLRPLVVYLNRLSDLLFVLARVVNHRAGVADIPWTASCESRRPHQVSSSNGLIHIVGTFIARLHSTTFEWTRSDRALIDAVVDRPRMLAMKTRGAIQVRIKKCAGARRRHS